MKYSLASFLSMLLLLPQTVYSFTVNGVEWPTKSTLMQVQFSGGPNTPTGIDWNAAFEVASDRWGPAGFTLLINNPSTPTDPCGNSNHQNDIGFHPNPCGFDPDGPGSAQPGDNFGSSTLGVTLTIYTPSTGFIVESDIVLNSNKTWNISSPPGGKGPAAYDFRRVVVHELGHLIGLGHEGANPSIMKAFIGNTENPQTDDAAGVASIYSGLPSSNTAPSITNNAAINVLENTGPFVNIAHTDSEGGSMHFEIAGGVDALKFSLGAASGVLAFSPPADYENPTDSNTDNNYEVVVKVTDHAGLSSSKVLTVTVIDVASETIPPGDANGDSIVTVQDVTDIISIVFGAGTPLGNGENCDGVAGITIYDVVCAIDAVLP